MDDIEKVEDLYTHISLLKENANVWNFQDTDIVNIFLELGMTHSTNVRKV